VVTVVPTSDVLKTTWARVASVSAVVSTIALSGVLLFTGRPPLRLLILWVGCFPALWLALRIVGAIAWDTSFKSTSRIRVAASPTQVFVAEIVCLLAMLAVHAGASLAWAFEGIGVAVILAWLLYAISAIAVSVLVYLPSLLIAKVLVRHGS
jgi:hypothetical protein